MIFIQNFNNDEGKKIILNSKEKFISLMENIMVQQGYMREDEIFVELKPQLESHTYFYFH